MTKKSKFILVLVSTVTIAITSVLAVRQLELSATLKITAVPLKSKITVNGQAARQGSNHTRPGSKTVTVSMPGFKSVSQTVSVKKGETQEIGIVLVSNSNSTANWYLTHSADEKAAESISSKANDSLAKEAIQKTPLIQLLPFVAGGLEFRVDYGNLPGVNNNLPIIYITALTEKAQQDGINWIKSLGYNPADYKISTVTEQVKPLNP